MTEKQIVYPGDEVGEAEQFLAGPGTYVNDHKILAAQVGELVINSRELTVFVKPIKPMNDVKNGDIVIATVDDLKASMVTLDVHRIEHSDREVTGETHAAIHVAKCSQDYVRDLEDVYRITDVVRAKVIQAAPSVQLDTRDDDLGVIKALCHYCRSPMTLRDRRLWCEECERFEDRKISTRFGEEHSPGVEHMRVERKGD